MRLDSHCHIDLFDDPVGIARAYESSQTECVMATMLPSHYTTALPHLKPFLFIKPSLGMHPLRAIEGKNEIITFVDLAYSAEYIGEIGLDFSTEGKTTKALQLAILKEILPSIGRHKFITVHSRYAHEDLVSLLDECQVGPVCFHYFVGGPRAAERLAAKGHYFSINSQMLKGRHRNLIDVVPRERILVESDGPFLTKRPLATIEYVYNELGRIWHTERMETEKVVSQNFGRCRTIG